MSRLFDSDDEEESRPPPVPSSLLQATVLSALDADADDPLA
jgi:hypothetical protein